MKVMKNVVLIHSYNADTLQGFAISVEKVCKENKIDYIAPQFPIRQEANYEAWEDVMNKYNVLSEDTIVIAHSLGTQFILKYLVRNNIKINTYISVAGFINFTGRKDLEETLNKFKVENTEFEQCKNLIENRICIYSDNDALNSIENLEGYANKLNAKKILLEKYAHFSPKDGIEEIKELNEFIKN